MGVELLEATCNGRRSGHDRGLDLPRQSLLVRQLMERQAVRRMEAGTLSDDQIERMGETFMKLEEGMGELPDHFGLSPEDPNLDLGPLGRLM
jgi:hypothetical protein